MAVPTGEYEVRTSVDLTPFFGVILGEKKLRIEQPGPDALEKLLARFQQADAGDRWELVGELALFTDAGDEVVPLLVAIAARPDEESRFSAVYALCGFPAHADLARGTLLSLLSPVEPIGCAAAHALGTLYPRASPLCQAYCEAYERGQPSLAARAAGGIRRLLGP